MNVLAAVIFQDKKIYCFRRVENKYNYLSNKLEFPGGKIEKGLSKEQALKREIFKELKIDILVNNQLIEIKNEYPEFIVIMSCYACKILK